VFEPAVLPVAMRRHNPWEWSLSTEWTVEVPAQIEAWNRFEKNFFYCVTLTFQFAENLSVQGPLFRHWQQSCAAQDLLSQKGRSLQPPFASGEDRHLVMRARSKDSVSCVLFWQAGGG